MGFEVGQRVKVIGNESEFKSNGAGGTIGMTGAIILIESPDDFEFNHLVEIDDEYKSAIWYKPEHLEVIPDDGKPSTATPQPPIKYPPLRVMLTDGKPSQTWQQLLRTESQAVASQPHLYLLGEYDIWSAINLYTNKTTPYIKMDYIGRDDSESMFLVFVIDEGE